MTNETTQEEIAQLTLEHLKYIRSGIDRMGDDLHDVKTRLTNVEEGLAGVNRRLDRTDLRLLTLEKRLGLVDA